jgi:hypothetical protein
MTTFKVGDRVRIVDPSAELFGREATVISDLEMSCCYRRSEYIGRHAVHRLRVDGFGDRFDGLVVCAARPCDIEPLTRPPLLSVEEEVKRLFERTDLIDFNPKPRQGEIVQAGDV